MGTPKSMNKLTLNEPAIKIHSQTEQKQKYNFSFIFVAEKAPRKSRNLVKIKTITHFSPAGGEYLFSFRFPKSLLTEKW